MSKQASLTKVVAAQTLGDLTVTPHRRRLRARHELAVIQAEIRRLSRTTAPRRSPLATRAPGTNRV
jgi:hypothetical protein